MRRGGKTEQWTRVEGTQLKRELQPLRLFARIAVVAMQTEGQPHPPSPRVTLCPSMGGWVDGWGC